MPVPTGARAPLLCGERASQGRGGAGACSSYGRRSSSRWSGAAGTAVIIEHAIVAHHVPRANGEEP